MEELRESKIGTTQRGIGPCYSDKNLRIGIRAGDIFDSDKLKKKIELALRFINPQLVKIYNKPAFTVDEIFKILDFFKEKAGVMITDSQAFLHNAVNNKKKILLEGAQGFALDIDHGTYPYVTSSNPTIGGALAGSGLNTFNIDNVIGIAKAYVTRVGEGPLPTEDEGDDGDRLRVNGKEFGSTTGRPRRCGWFDVPLLKQSKLVNGLSNIALTKLDVLTGFKKIKIAVGYEFNGQPIDYFPAAKLSEVKPIYEEVDGWDEDISEAKKFSDLPKNTQKYVNYIEKLIGIPIVILSVGPGREATFYKDKK
jgi:adenylosuccinate synthase